MPLKKAKQVDHLHEAQDQLKLARQLLDVANKHNTLVRPVRRAIEDLLRTAEQHILREHKQQTQKKKKRTAHR